MAEVDFSNARLAPYGTHPAASIFTSLYDNVGSPIYIMNANRAVITSEHDMQVLSSTNNKLVVLHTGTFNASGTAFYIADAGSNIHWQVSNITFASGDTFNFQTSVNLSIV